jgi:hypothetical protein
MILSTPNFIQKFEKRDFLQVIVRPSLNSVITIHCEHSLGSTRYFQPNIFFYLDTIKCGQTFQNLIIFWNVKN